MVVAPCLGLYKVTQGRCCTNLLWICPKNTVNFFKSLAVAIFILLWNLVFTSLFSLTLGRGGQSALRFARLRMEKRHNYVRKVAETAVQLFVSNDKVNVAGLVLAGSADFKTELSQSDMFDPVCSHGIK